jgi:hypothetical protein
VNGIVNVGTVAIVQTAIVSVSALTAETVVIETVNVSVSTAVTEIAVTENASVRIGIGDIAASVLRLMNEEAIDQPENVRGATAPHLRALQPVVDRLTAVEEFSTARAANTISSPRK